MNMEKMKKISSLAVLSALLAAPAATVSAKEKYRWWQRDNSYEVKAMNLDKPTNSNKVYVVFFKGDGWYDPSSEIPMLGKPAPDWLKNLVNDGTPPPEGGDLCKVVEVMPNDTPVKAKVPYYCWNYVAVQGGTVTNPSEHFNGTLLKSGHHGGYKPTYGEGYNLGAQTGGLGFIYSEALGMPHGTSGATTTTTTTLRVNVQEDWGY